MVKFAAKLLLLICMLLVGLLLGIQQAEHGIFSLQSFQEAEKESLYIKKVDEDHIEVAVLGEEFSTKEWEERQEKFKQKNHHNRLSHVGNKLGEIVYTTSRKGAEWFVIQLDKML